MRSLALGLIVLVALSGCHQAPPTWSLSANGHTEMEGNEVRFIGDVELGGNHDRTTLSGVKVEFRTANHTQLRTVHLGTFGDGGQNSAGLNETFHEPPEFVLVKVENVDTQERYRWSISDLRRTEDGHYDPSYTDYDPFVGTPRQD